MRIVLPLCLFFAACSGASAPEATTDAPADKQAAAVAQKALPQLQYFQIGPS